MRIWTFSDLHLRSASIDITDVLPSIPRADICVCAGDLVGGDAAGGIEWLAKHIRPHMRVIVVLGNHEFYGRSSSMEEIRQVAKRAAKRLEIELLDDTAITIDGIRIVGTTLWSDFDIFARGDGVQRANAMRYCSDVMNDFRLIRPDRRSSKIWTPALAAMQHMASRLFLERELAQTELPVVVVSHHAPHPTSIAPEFAKSLATPAFVSDLSAVIERYEPRLWIHGHTHASFHYNVGKTAIVCNPLGYRHETTGFDPGKVVEL